MLISRMTLAGLAVMAAAALCSAIWPAVAAVVVGLFVSLVVVAVAVPAGFGARWARGELAWRRELRTMPASAEAATYGPGPVVPSLAELRNAP